ncbi:MAG: NAD-dependent epimerase/dehydratase family protein [Bacteroidales bacterium]|jgi:CDP-paratose 2-epimerase
MKRILITGGMGFVGSNLASALKLKYPEYSIIAFDNLKRRGSELNINRLVNKGITFIHGDIRNKTDFEEIGKIDCIIDAAAEPSVLAGIDSSTEYLIDTNLNGTINTLYFAKKHKSDFIFLSTSRIYPISQLEKIEVIEKENRIEIAEKQSIQGISSYGISENFPIEGARSYYGATKLASELFVKEFNQFAGIRTVINRCGVIAGPWQMGKIDQGVTVLWVARHFWKKSLSYIGYGGTGKQVRDALHINDLFDLVDWQIHNIDNINGETFNVGGGVKCSFSLKELTQFCQQITGNTINIGSVKENREGDIRLYLTDNTKVNRLCGWTPKTSINTLVKDVYEWIINNETQLSNILNN